MINAQRTLCEYIQCMYTVRYTLHIGRVDKLFNELMGGCFDQPGIINQCLSASVP